MIRLIVSDVDGTLIEDGTSDINQELFRIIQKLKQKGIIFVAASGRSCESLKQLFQPVVEHIYYISDNGAYISYQDKDIEIHKMEQHIINEIILEARQIPNCELYICSKDKAYIESTNEEYVSLLENNYKVNLGKEKDLLKVKDDLIKLSIYDGQGVSCNSELVMLPKWKDKSHVAVAGDVWLDFMAKGINKGKAVKSLQKYLGISKEETMVFGDNFNDIEMLQEAAESYVVEKAHEDVRKFAKYLVEGPHDNGVINILKNLI